MTAKFTFSTPTHWIPFPYRSTGQACIGMVGEGVLTYTTTTFVILDLIEDPGYQGKDYCLNNKIVVKTSLH